MNRKSSVMKIFCRSSLILKIDASRLWPKECSPVLTMVVAAVAMTISSKTPAKPQDERQRFLGVNAKNPQESLPLILGLGDREFHSRALDLRRLHLVADRLFRTGDLLGRAPLGLDLLQCGLGEVPRLD